MSPILKVFHFMEGTWHFQRTFSTGGSVKGMAVFKKSSLETDVLEYKENGIFTTPDEQVFTVYRDYVYRCQNNQISAYFPDGRHFHTLEFDEKKEPLTATGSHLCACDTYKASYLFFLEIERFELQYKVEGPKKNFSIDTIFTKR